MLDKPHLFSSSHSWETPAAPGQRPLPSAALSGRRAPTLP